MKAIVTRRRQAIVRKPGRRSSRGVTPFGKLAQAGDEVDYAINES